MKIESISIKNYKALKNTKVEKLPYMCVFLGINGTGKSTLFDIFSFLRDALYDNVTVAIKKRGGFHEVISRASDERRDSIIFDIRFREDSTLWKSHSPETPYQLEIKPLMSYFLEIIEENGKIIVATEKLRIQERKPGLPWKDILDSQRGSGFAISTKDGRHEREAHKIASPDILALKGLGQFERFSTISKLRHLLEKWHISNFSVEAARTIPDIGTSQHLSATGDNLAQVTKYLYEEHRGVFEKILEKLPRRIKGLAKVEATETVDGRIVLRFQDENFADPFVSRYVSDGTIKMFAYMVLLNDPTPHPLLCIEEPENYLHPDLLVELAEEIREYAERGGQVFVSTHSPDFVNGIEINELFFLEKKKGFSEIKAAADDEVIVALNKEKNPLGWLWRNHYIKGANLK
jgi:predicted ATPase